VNNEGAFTLIELVVAILIFAVGITGIAKMQLLAIQGDKYSMDMTDAVNIAQDLVERRVAQNDVSKQIISVTGTKFNYTVDRDSSGPLVSGGYKAINYDVTVNWNYGLNSYNLTMRLDPNS